MSGNWDSEYERLFLEQRLDAIQREYDALQADGVAQKRLQMRPSDLDRLDRTEEVARANQRNWTEERAWRRVWQFVAGLAIAVACVEGAFILWSSVSLAGW